MLRRHWCGVHCATVRRVSVVGVSGSGKSTVARALAARLGSPHIELDAIFHQPGWVGLDDNEFSRRVDAATRGDSWVVDGNYGRIQQIVWARADTVVFLDLPRWQVMTQLLVRTLHRGVTGAELWNGNREHLRNLIRPDPEQNILLWSWTHHAINQLRYRSAALDPRWSHLTFLTARSRRRAQEIVESAGPETG